MALSCAVGFISSWVLHNISCKLAVRHSSNNLVMLFHTADLLAVPCVPPGCDGSGDIPLG